MMLKGKAGVVTGSTSGIGLGIARALAEAGCDVMLNGFGEAPAIEHVRKQINADFVVNAAFNPADLSEPGEVTRLVEAATRELGRVDIVVNNAGIQHTAPVETFPADRWDAVLAINLSANFHTNSRRASRPHRAWRIAGRSGGPSGQLDDSRQDWAGPWTW